MGQKGGASVWMCGVCTALCVCTASLCVCRTARRVGAPAASRSYDEGLRQRGGIAKARLRVGE